MRPPFFFFFTPAIFFFFFFSLLTGQIWVKVSARVFGRWARINSFQKFVSGCDDIIVLYIFIYNYTYLYIIVHTSKLSRRIVENSIGVLENNELYATMYDRLLLVGSKEVTILK